MATLFTHTHTHTRSHTHFKHLNHSCHCWNYGFTRLLTTALCWFVCVSDC